MVWTLPHERVDDFFIYIDHMKTLTDTFVVRFDGDDLSDAEKINEIWQLGEGE